MVSTEPSDLSEPGESASEDLAFDVVMEETVRSFSVELPAAPARTEQVKVPAAPTFEPMVIGEDLYTGTAYALNRASEGTDLPPLGMGERTAAADAEPMAVASESFEPMVVDDDLYAGVAYSLNRASEGLDIVPESPTLQSPVVSSPTSQLSVALRLTREAVYAWSNLLHGPAVVAISR